MRRRAIMPMFAALTPSGYSHGSGYIWILHEQLRNAGIEAPIGWSAEAKSMDWNGFDEIYLWQGLDMNGKLAMNLFGGQCEANAAILNKLATYRGKVTPILYPMRPYHELRSRNWDNVPGISDVTWAALERRFNEKVAPLSNPGAQPAIAVGDSHIMSRWRAWDHIDVRSGQTLHGALVKGLDSYIPDVYSRATLYFGQIDLRHHLCRQAQPATAARELANEYIRQVSRLVRDRKMHVEVCLLHPVESEDRVIPKTGYYKGTPFTGSWAERERCRELFNYAVGSYAAIFGYEVHKYPASWQDLLTKRMKPEYMEKPRSVHIAPQHYRSFDYATQ